MEPESMIIVSGVVYVDPNERDMYLSDCRAVMAQAREAPGCLDFALSPDALDPGRINVYERWESDEQLLEFRNSGSDTQIRGEIREAHVAKYRIAAVEDP